MRQFCLIILMLLIYSSVYCQKSADVIVLKGFGDTYVASVTLKKKISSAKRSCNMPDSGVYSLYQGVTDSIFYAHPNSLLDSISVQKIQFFAVAGDVGMLLKAIVTLSPGSDNYLIIRKDLKLSPDGKVPMFLHDASPVLTRPIKCYKLNVFTRILLKMHLISSDKLNWKDKKLRTDPFDDLIKKTL